MKWIVCCAALAACTDASVRASADRISSRDQLIGGPKALGQIGDYLLENDKIRVIIQAPGAGRGSTVFGGSLLDADLRRPMTGDVGGNDQMGELLPSFLLQAMDPATVTVARDGKDGGPAVVSVEGGGGDLLQMVAVLNTGILFPGELRFRQDYQLSPGNSYVDITTTITNTSTASHPLPFLDPLQLEDLGLDIPGLENLQLSVPMGHLLLFGAENETFAPGATGFNLRFAIEGSYAIAQGFPAFPGLVVDFLATRGKGVSYGFAIPPSPDDYPWSFRDRYAPQPVTDHSFDVPYLYAAVTGVFTHDPPASLAPGESYSYRSWFIVGRGDVGSVVDTMFSLWKVPTGAFAGHVLDEQTQAPVERASVVVKDGAGRYVSQYDSDAGGAFRGLLPPGDYTYRVVTDARPTTQPVAFRVAQGETTAAWIRLPPPGRIGIQVVDELGRAVPCKVGLVGHFPGDKRGQDPRTFLYNLADGERMRPTAFDPQSTEYLEISWYTAEGLLTALVRPGDYDLVVSRGVEYDVHREPITVPPGSTVTRSVTLARAFDTPGYVSADLHLHAVNSVDSSMPLTDRVVSVAAEGIDFAAATDHNFLTDYAPAIAQTGLTDWLTACVGLELSTFEMGHFNGYPLRIDPGNVRGGDFNWPGETPDSLFAQLRKLGDADTVVEVNHARDGVLGYFTAFNVDPETAAPSQRRGLRSVFAPFRPEFAPEAFSYDFDVLEVMNGKRMELNHTYRAPDPLPPPPLPDPPPAPGDIVRDDYGKIAYPGQIEDWFAFLQHGLTYTAVGNSDSHQGLTQEPGYPRSFIWVGEGNDVQGRFTARDVVAGLRSHRVIVTNGPFVELEIGGRPIGSLVPVGAQVTAHVRVRSADFAPVTRVTLWVNGDVAAELAVPAGQAHDFSADVPLGIDADTWVVAEAAGDASMFPVVPPQEFGPLNVDQVINALGAGLNLGGLSPAGNLRPDRTFRVTPIGLTNPIWLDRDANGRFDPPLGPIARTSKPAGVADVRRAFEDLSDSVRARRAPGDFERGAAERGGAARRSERAEQR